jgi:hypothetical protein
MPDFTLQPFAGQTTAGLSLAGTIERRESAITLSFVLAGDLDALAIPAPDPVPVRAENLWQATCFEMFWTEEGKENYWELNLAPTGNWNAYAFSAYRQGMRREERIPCPSFDARRRPEFILSTKLDLSGLHHGRAPLRVGLCAVLKEKSNRLTCWALAHPEKKPDFHAAAGFAILLP